MSVKTDNEQRVLKPEETFLASAIEQHVKHGLLTQADLFKLFPIDEIMLNGYGEKAPHRRAQVAAACTGLSEPTASGMLIASQGQLLKTWYTIPEPEQDKPKKAFEAISAGDFVRFLDQKKIVLRLKEARASTHNKPEARENAAVLLDKLIELKLLGQETWFEIYETIGFEHLASIDPKVLAAAIQFVAYKIKGKDQPKGTGIKPEVKDFYEKLGSKALVTLDLNLVEQVFTAFEVKYKLETPKPPPLPAEPALPALPPTEEERMTGAPQTATDAAKEPVLVPQADEAPAIDLTDEQELEETVEKPSKEKGASGNDNALFEDSNDPTRLMTRESMNAAKAGAQSPPSRRNR